MRQLQLTSVHLVPHAPLLLDGIGPPDADRAAIRKAAGAIPLDGDLTVMLSPHGARAGVYRAAVGSLRPQGLALVSVERPTDPVVVEELARVWSMPVLDEPLDHGAVVALLLAEVTGPVVVACLSEISGPDPAPVDRAIEEGDAFVRALLQLDAPAGSFLATAHSGAALHERGPLGKRPQAPALEERLIAAIEHDPDALREVAVELAREGGSCGSGVLAALAALDEVVPGPGRIGAYGAPAGVGYVVASLPASAATR